MPRLHLLGTCTLVLGAYADAQGGGDGFLSNRSSHAEAAGLLGANATALGAASVAPNTIGPGNFSAFWVGGGGDGRGGAKDGPCDVDELLQKGSSSSYYLFNRFHDEYLSQYRDNVDLYHDRGSHALWHFERVSETAVNRFRIVNDDAQKYLASYGQGNHDNVEVWSSSWRSPRRIEWLVFSAGEITARAPRCTFYLMHSASYKFLDTHGDNAHLWGHPHDIWDMGTAPENMQWEFVP
eukprot:CAMPEP_0117499214 /NCGR_PEP_ID=MMETSP0784-20121206/22128_1 /TAXON_ID=39447 /ORGANISM="" /LENGTH=237 /DNA_ID=CAMNT_0005294351 /DNA_START=133 /DNA_END=842 /DNA_ORIENTATION=-